MKNEILEQASKDIRLLSVRRQAIEGIRARIRLLDADVGAIGGSDFDRLKVKRSRNRHGRQHTRLEQKERLQEQEGALLAIIEHTERVLQQMHEDDALVLSSFYGDEAHRGEVVRRLGEQLHVSQTEIYRIRERALEEFAGRMGYIV